LVIDGIFTKAQILLQFREFGKRLKEFPEKEYRELLYKRYRIIYKLKEDEIYIMTIIHSARLLKNVSLFRDEI